MVAELFAAYCCYAYNKPNSMVESKRYMKSFMKRPYWYNKVKQRVLEMVLIVNDISVKKFGHKYE